MSTKLFKIKQNKSKFLALLAQKGASFTANKYNISRQYVYYIAKTLSPTKQLTFYQLKNIKLKKDIKSGDYTVKQLAEKYRVHINTIYHHKRND